jgi:hypothetical protein
MTHLPAVVEVADFAVVAAYVLVVSTGPQLAQCWRRGRRGDAQALQLIQDMRANTESAVLGELLDWIMVRITPPREEEDTTSSTSFRGFPGRFLVKSR